MTKFRGRLGLQQRVIPNYRVPFFDMLADACEGGLSVFAGLPRPAEGIAVGHVPRVASYFPGRNLHFHNPSSSAYLCLQGGIISWLAEWDPDALIVEATPRIISTFGAVRWMSQRKRPVLGWGLGAPRTGNSLERSFRIFFLRALDGIIAYSRRGAFEYRALGLKNIHLAFNAVEPRVIKNLSSKPLEPNQQPVVLFVGRLQRRKRIDILLAACRDLPKEIQPRLIIVGDGPARETFERMARTVYPQTSFVGARHGAELAPYYEMADLFALPGTGGLAVHQAMAYGLPVVVAKGDGTQDDLVREGNGWQVKPGDQLAFKTALQDALKDLHRLRRMGAESYRIVQEDINLETMVESFVRALNVL